MIALGRNGILLLRYRRDDDFDLAVNYHAQVVDGKLLARRVPELKEIASSLTRLALY
jgi:hypothetical protein